MGLMDAFSAEKTFEIKYGDLYELTRAAAIGELIMNAVKCDVPPVFIREMATGKPEAKENICFSFHASKIVRNEDVPDEEDQDPEAGQDAGAAAGQEEGSGEDA